MAPSEWVQEPLNQQISKFFSALNMLSMMNQRNSIFESILRV